MDQAEDRGPVEERGAVEDRGPVEDVRDVEERGPAAYIAEFIGTFGLVLFITMAASLYVSDVPGAFIDFSVIGLVHTFALFMLIQALAAASGAHLNPAVTVGLAALRQIKPVDAAIYVVIQLAGGLVGALVTKVILGDADDFNNFGAPAVGPILDGDTLPGMLAEGLGTFFLMFVIVGVAVNPRAAKDWAALSIAAALGLAVFAFGPLTGGSFNPARAFGPSLVSGEFGGAGQFLAVYVVAPVAGAVLAAVTYFRLYIVPDTEDAGGGGPLSDREGSGGREPVG